MTKAQIPAKILIPLFLAEFRGSLMKDLQSQPFSSNISQILRGHVEKTLAEYLAQFKDHVPGNLHELVINCVEQPLIELVLKQVKHNQSQAAKILGMNRATLNKKIHLYGLTDQTVDKAP